MTAEIAILNSTAVALAADSASTTYTSEQKKKIYNSANKLFNLNKYHPIGIMVYNEANFMGMSWETIIKYYRSKREKNLSDTIKDELKSFIEFLENDFDIFTQKYREDYIMQRIQVFFDYISEIIDKEVEKEVKISKSVDENQIEQIVKKILNGLSSNYNNSKFWKQYTIDDKNLFIENYRQKIKDLINNFFGKFQLCEELINQIIDLSALTFFKTEPRATGIVIAGFGLKEFNPSLQAMEVECLINNRLKYNIINEIESIQGSSILPFARKEIAESFLYGIHPLLYETIYNGLSTMFKKFDDSLRKLPELLDVAEKDKIIKKISEMNNGNLKSLYDEISNIIKIKMTDPVVKSVMSLPKEELAAMAESLVYLTYMRMRISQEDETVGGAVDVAVISKGDGFIWIKRKHYFDSELNPHFFKNYFK